jgi:uncharacterized protein
MMLLDDRLKADIARDARMMRLLEAARELALPGWCIAAGFVRNMVWDLLHGYGERTPLNDLDLIYYDADDLREETEKRYEDLLQQAELDGQQDQASHWSAKNQARMHLRNGDAPYASLEDAMKRWPETATAVGVRLLPDDSLEVIAPHGLTDLYELLVRQSPHYGSRAVFEHRVRSKRWLELWPKLRVASPDESHYDGIGHLADGNGRQRGAYALLKRLQLMDKLAEFDPLLVGTVPIDIDVPGSDLDIICEVRDAQRFLGAVKQLFSDAGVPVECVTRQAYGTERVVVQADVDGWPIELFGQPVPVKRQNGYQHMIVEARLLERMGREGREAIRSLKAAGMKTEPAFARYLGMDVGDPYIRLAALYELGDAELRAVLEHGGGA